MSTINLDAELNAEAEAPLRQVDAQRTGARAALDAALGDRAGKSAPPKVVGLIRRAVKIMDDGPGAARKAGQLCLKAINAAPDFALAYQGMALALERLGRLSASLSCYEKAYQLDPGNADLYLNLGMVAWKLDMLEAAEKFMRLHNQMAPNAKGGVSNLAGLLRDRQKYEDSVELLRAAIYTDPENADLWNSLGTTLLESGDPEQALTFYQEALRLRPNFARAHHNIAFCLDLLGDGETAIEHWRTSLTLDPSAVDRVTIEHGLSMALFAQGELKEGWEKYERRMDPLYSKRVEFVTTSPFWSGEDVSQVRGKRLLIVGEQGLGDEIAMAAALDEAFDLVGPDGAVGLVCERRLVDLLRRSFPQLDYVGRHATIFKEGVQIRSLLEAEPTFKPDLWAPMGSLQRAIRQSPEDFPGGEARQVLTPDADRVEAIKAQLDALPPGLRVGFCWKSKLMTGNRTKYFSPFEMWKPVLQTPGCTFVSLQYGEVDAELAQCAKDFGVTIHQIEGLDLMEDLEGVGILGAACDVMVGQVNASLTMGAHCGGESLLLSPSKIQWTTFGTGRLPWMPGSQLFAPEKFRDWKTPIGQIAEALAKRVELAKKSAA
jgi:tetratricopeptide (TPR) repeat protein